jgi:glycosyltransferase involved in cell wall biosynthesis
MNLVSIVTPVYNAEKFINKCIASVLNQTYPNWEMILVDDCSPDNSSEIILEYAQKDDRIKYHKLKKNGGAGVARNQAISMATGRYLAFLDSDDFWHPAKLEKQIEFLKEKNAPAVYSQYYIFNQTIGKPTHIVKSPERVDFKKMQKNDYIGFLTFLLDTKKTGKPMMPTIRRRQDWAYKLIVFKPGFYALGIQEPLAYYRVGNESLSSNKFRLLKYNFGVFRNVLGYSFVKSIVKMAVFLCHYFYFKAISKEKIINN